MLEYLEKRNLPFWIIAGSLFVAGMGLGDILTGSELAFSLFYLFPIVLVTWFYGRNLGWVMSVASAAMWFIADVLTGTSYSHPMIRYWNAAVRLGFFVFVTWLLPAVKALPHEKGLARTDHLTGIANRRYFFELAQAELDRSQRYKHAITIAYIDIDDFKTVNDQLGHRMGDILLCAVVDCAKSQLRSTDVLARLGGDEFVILLPETDQDAAKAVISKIQNSLTDEMRLSEWPVAFSIGVLTALEKHITPDELTRKADGLMYSVKKNGKNAVAYEVWK